MPVINAQVFKILEELAPKHYAEEWDNVGLQVGSPSNEAKRILLALDLTEEVVREAEENHAELIITHHPLLMKGLKNINLDMMPGRIIARLVKNDITVYSAHTNLDSVNGGVNCVLAEKLELEDIQVLHITGSQQYAKLVVFIPKGHQDQVRDALSNAGAGWIGNYSDCTFQGIGTGTFRPRDGSNPYIGQHGEVEQVEEIRLETIVPMERIDDVIKAMTMAHPYEEVAYDIYPLKNRGTSRGLGRIGFLPQALPFSDFIKKVKQSLGLGIVKFGGMQNKSINSVAVCGGSGGELWPLALSKGADVLVSGDIKYHTAQDMTGAGLCFVDAGHFHSEIPVIEKLQSYLNNRFAAGNIDAEIMISKLQKDPFMYF